MTTKKPVSITVKSYLLMFDFQMPNDLTDEIIHELGTEVAETFRSFFAAKRQPLPISGTLTIMRAEEGELCDCDEPAIQRKRSSNGIRSNNVRDKDSPHGNNK